MTTNFVGGPNRPIVVSTPATTGGEVTLVWTAIEGGTYQVDSSLTLNSWSPLANGIAAVGNQASVGAGSIGSPGDRRFYRVTATAVADYDPATGSTTSGGGSNQGPALASISPASGTRGSTVTVTFTLGQNPPPVAVNPTSALLGTLTGTNLKRADNTVTASFVIPSTATPGTVTASVVFPGPPGTGDVTFSLVDGFRIQ